MTNLDIIKYLALNKPERLGELLDDIYCVAWNNGSYAGSNGEGKILEECEIDDFEEWIKQDAAESGFFFEDELKEWSEPIKQHAVEVSYPGGLTVAFPYKDPTYAWNTNNEFEVNKYPNKENN